MSLPPRNLLDQEASPYLLQHKDNPVHWRPWRADTLKEAQERNRPILLSIGYAACHWCHVMAHESFENQAVAEVMNRLFVNIKVDREERPDIDQIYMAALNATGEQGGWPLTMFLTPDAKPFWGGTYFPPEPRYGRPGFIQVLEAINKAWGEKKDDISQSAAKLTAFVGRQLSPENQLAAFSAESLPRLAEAIQSMMDPEKGGLNGAPKFPNAPMMSALWLNWLANGDRKNRDSVLNSLIHILNGGIYDHVGGGLCRYSTDADWLVPHFEKMLYDNAQLIRLCCWAFGETGEELFRVRIEETVEWLKREMTVKGPAFAASLDADSDGEEGSFYTWTSEEISRILAEDAGDFLRTYRLSKPAQWEGDPILHRSIPKQKADVSRESVFARPSLERLRLAREHRVRPGRDDKILIDWNGFALRALAEASRLLERQDWLDHAEAIYRFIGESIDADGRLPHSIRGENRLFPAMATDYASIINAAVSLFEATQNQRYLVDASNWMDKLDQWYRDESGVGYYLTASDSHDVPLRIRGDTDEAIPSSTAQIIEAIARLANVSGDGALAIRCEAVVAASLGRIADRSYGQAGIICAAALAADPHKLLLVEGPVPAFVPVASRHPDPRRVDIAVGLGAEAANLPGNVLPDTSRPAAWLCRDQACLPPFHDPDRLETALKRGV
ncbi:MAG: thioredoxin domain-containing protein [Rhizobiaceae bacterium]